MVTHKYYRALSWYGGKRSFAQPVGRWITNKLGSYTECAYVEPFAGMCGVLLRRPQSKHEIINDLDGLVTNWWTVIRDEYDQLSSLLNRSPSHSRPLYEECIRQLEEPITPANHIMHAYSLTVVQCSSFMSLADTGAWAPTFSPNSRLTKLPTDSSLHQLSNRMRHVQIENTDALNLLQRTTAKKNCLIYCDPPYNAHTDPYRATIDHDRLADVLLLQNSKVACSGYRDQMPKLDSLGGSGMSCTLVCLLDRTGAPITKSEPSVCG